MKRIIYFVLFGLMNIVASSQTTFERYYTNIFEAKNPLGRCVVQTEDQGYVVCSPFTIDNQEKFILMKITPSGDTVRKKLFDGYATSFLSTSDGGFVIAGDRNGQLIMMKTNAVFEEQWIKTMGQSTLSDHSVCQSNDSGFCAIGGKVINENMCQRLCIAKTDKNGDSLWTKYFGEYYRHFDGRSIISTSDSGFVICGSFRPAPGTYSSIFLLKLNSQGDSMWMKTYSGSQAYSYSYGYVVLPNEENGYMITGFYSASGLEQLFLINTNSIGDTLWTRKYTCIYNSGVLSATKIMSGGYMVAGSEATEVWQTKVCLVRIAENGDTSWTKKVGTMTTEMSMSIKQTVDQGYIITGGSLYPPSQNSDIYLIKTDSIGNFYPLSVSEIKNNSLMLYPNPARKTFNLEFDDPVDKLEIFDIYGRSVFYSIVQSKEGSVYAITIDNVRQGIYLLKITGGNKIISKRVIMSN